MTACLRRDADPVGQYEHAEIPPAGDPAASLHDSDAMTVADARLEIVLAFDEWRSRRGLTLTAALRMFVCTYKQEGLVSGEAIALVQKFSWKTLQRWRSGFRRHGVAGLEDARSRNGRAPTLDTDPEMAEVAEGQLWAKWPHVSASQIKRTIETDLPDRKAPSVRAIQRWIGKWVEKNRGALSAVTNPDGHRSKRRPAFGTADSEIVKLNQLWELDSTRIDIICADGKRHSLVAAIDVWSRRARCLVAPQSSSAAISALVRRCILEWGVPTQVATDEGADYTSKHLRRALADLKVAHIVLPPYSPEKKPFVERFIGTISRDLFSQLLGFVGHSVADREAIRSRHSFAGRRGKGVTDIYRSDLKPEQLQEKIDAWCEAIYDRAPHSGLDGETPFQKAAGWRGVQRTVDPRALDILLAKPARGDGTCTVGKKGIATDGGLYIAAELGPLVGEKVHVRLDPTDYGTIHVFHATGDSAGVFVCIARDPLRTGIDRQEVAAQAVALSRAADREARKHAKNIIRATQADTAMDRVLEKSMRDADRVLPFPRPVEAHTGDMIDAAATAADAIDQAGTADRRTGDDGDRVIDSFMSYYLGGNSNE